MKRAAIIILVILTLVTAGCSTDSSKPIMECAAPLIQKGAGCCLDADKDGVCDLDEKKAAQAKPDANKTVNQTGKETVVKENVTAPPEKEEQDKPKEKKPLLNTKEEAEKVGKLFAERWQLKQYNTMYILFTPGLKKQKSASEFTAIMELDPFYKKINKVEFRGVVLVDEDTADLNIVAHTNIQEIQIPAATLEFTEGAWKINIFADVFQLTLYDAACSGYRYNKKYRLWDCAFDLAKKVKDSSYCNITKCHHVECLKALGKPAGLMEEAEQCFDCQPVGKTTNECILAVAIKYDRVGACNVISDKKYSDKYCTCYGGFARNRNSNSYCNMIENTDYKDACLKGYGGGYC